MKYFKLYIFLIFLSLPFSQQLFSIYEPIEFFSIIKIIEISKEDSEKLIKNLSQILERYVYLDILKNPPQPKENYHNKVYLIEELQSVNTEKRPLIDFYKDVKTIIDKCQDLHLNIILNKNLKTNSIIVNSFIISPVIFKIENKKVYSLKNTYGLSEEIPFYENKTIKYINGLNPFDYIQTFNGNFRKIKSPQAQFVFNFNQINNIISFNDLPLDYTNLTNIKITYDDNSEIIFNYKILYIDEEENFLENFVFNIVYYYLEVKQIFYENFNLFDKWDRIFDDGNYKCTVDNENKVNVIYQNTFNSDLTESYEFFDECFSDFNDNIYPIIIIQSFNGGGYEDLADYLSSYINLEKSSAIYSSFRYNEQTKNFIAPLYAVKTIDTCELKNSSYFFNSSYKEDNYGITENGEKIRHKRTKIFDSSSVNENVFYNFRKKAKYIRKPHEIIIFTDGFSYSATSDLIKETQLKGGAIIVGYDGNPYLDTFDASQSPSGVHSTIFENTQNDTLSSEIESLGFSLSYTISESFSKLDDETNENIPIEYIIHEIDERVQLYNGYDDSKYDAFINESLKIFEKYKKKCNPKNKKLLFISDKCKFKDYRLHGGFECGDDGYWSEKCIPSYCDNGYVYDKKNKKCIKDICIKKEKFKFTKDNLHKIPFIVIFLFIITQLFFVIFFFKKMKRNKKYAIIILLIINIIFIIVFYIYI